MEEEFHRSSPGASVTARPASDLGRSVFIGRRRETDELFASLEDVIAGRGQLVILAGEPGIGKTRLVEELALRAASRGVQVLWGRCWEAGWAPAYWPWIQVLRDALRDREPQSLPQKAGGWIRCLLSTLPELREALPGFLPSDAEQTPPLSIPPSPAQPQPEPARFRLFDSAMSLLRYFAVATPLMIMIEDLHGADADSLRLLGFISRNLKDARIAVIVTYREVEVRLSSTHAELIGDIAREGRSIPLRGLAEAEVAEFIERNADFEVERPLVAALHLATGGNPFFLSEVVRLMLAEPNLQRPGVGGVPFAIPDGVRGAIRRRLSPLPESTRLALTVASVIGNEFDVATLGKVLALSGEQLRDVIDRASLLGLVSEHSVPFGQYRFNHALIAEALRTNIGKAELLGLHLRIGEALEESESADPAGRLAGLAYHFLQALPAGTAAKALQYARMGAAHAEKHLAYEEAARLYDMALRAQKTLSSPDLADRWKLWVALGETQCKAGDRTNGIKAFREAARIARQLESGELLAQAAVRCSVWSYTFFGVDHKVVAMLEEALGCMTESESALRASLLSRLAHELIWVDRERANELGRQAVEMARRVGDAAALVSALWTQHELYWGPDNPEKRLETASEIGVLAQRAGDLDWALNAREFKISALLEVGDFDAADREVQEFGKLEEESGHVRGTVERYRAMRSVLSGDFERANQQLAVLLETAQRRQEIALVMAYWAIKIQLSRDCGRCEEIIPVLKERVAQFPALILARCALAVCYAVSGRANEARNEFEYLAADRFSRIPRDWNWIASMAALAEVCASLGDVDRAATLYAELQPYADRNVTYGWGDVCTGSAAFYTGLLASTMCLFDEAQTHFEKALQLNSRMQARPAVVRTQLAYASMLLERNDAGDAQRALALADSALTAAGAMGMGDRVEQARALKSSAARAEEPPTPSARTVESGLQEAASKAKAAPVFRKEGDYWTITFGGVLSRLKDTKGLAYIAHLLRHPEAEFHALDLMAGIAPPASEEPGAHPSAGVTGAMSEEQLAELGLRRGAPEDAGEMLDPEAKAAYKRRLGELREELEDARELGNSERAEEIQEEIDALVKELARAVGLGGRDRRAASISERARLNVTRAIKSAIERIAENNAGLGRILAKTIKTGMFCSYLPDPREPISWQL